MSAEKLCRIVYLYFFVLFLRYVNINLKYIFSMPYTVFKEIQSNLLYRLVMTAANNHLFSRIHPVFFPYSLGNTDY